MAVACEAVPAPVVAFAAEDTSASHCASDTRCPLHIRGDLGGRRTPAALGTPLAAAILDGTVPPRRTKKYNLFGRTVALSEGDSRLSSELTNTGWKVWAGSWLLAKHFEAHLGLARSCRGGAHRILDLSCGTGLAGVALACAGHDVYFTDMDVNLPTIQENLLRNLPPAVGPTRASPSCDHDGTSAEQIARNNVVGYAWGAPLPPTLRRRFDIVACGDLLYHVWSGGLHSEFLSTLSSLRRQVGHGEPGPEFVFAFQVRSSRQENQVLNHAAFRLGFALEELAPATEADADCPLRASVRYRLVRLRPPAHGKEEAS